MIPHSLSHSHSSDDNQKSLESNVYFIWQLTLLWTPVYILIVPQAGWTQFTMQIRLPCGKTNFKEGKKKNRREHKASWIFFLPPETLHLLEGFLSTLAVIFRYWSYVQDLLKLDIFLCLQIIKISFKWAKTFHSYAGKSTSVKRPWWSQPDQQAFIATVVMKWRAGHSSREHQSPISAEIAQAGNNANTSTKLCDAIKVKVMKWLMFSRMHSSSIYRTASPREFDIPH